jgi:hypothetical protein
LASSILRRPGAFVTQSTAIENYFYFSLRRLSTIVKRPASCSPSSTFSSDFS